MPFSQEAIDKLRIAHTEADSDYLELFQSYAALGIRNGRAREHAHQGFARRLRLMNRCIFSVFKQLPPERSELPSADEIIDATISIQAFVFNAFGALDNLAWIWALARDLRVKREPIPSRFVGLGPGNIAVRESLSASFREHLESLDPWFKHLEDLRHALAHRIPLYIPPFAIAPRHEEAYRQLDQKMVDAIRNRDFATYDELLAEQVALGHFLPWIKHSFVEGSRPIVFHAQLLSDFATVCEIARMMRGELRGVGLTN